MADPGKLFSGLSPRDRMAFSEHMAGHEGDDGPYMTKAQAGYSDVAPDPSESCASCDMFRGGRCTLVMGPISPEGHCRYWELAGA